MSDNKVEVQFTASTDGVQAGASTAAKHVEDAASRMKSALSEAGTAGNSFRDSMSASMEGVKSSLFSVTDAFGSVGKAFAALGVILAGGAAFKSAVSESMKLNAEALMLSRSLGITATEASFMNTALGRLGLTADDAAGAAKSLAKQIRVNEGALNAMGLKTRESNGDLVDSAKLLRDAGAIVETYKSGIDRTIATQQLFGKGVSDSGVAVKLANLDMQKGEETARSLGLTITKENVVANKAFKISMDEVGNVFDGFKKTIGDAVMPILTKLGDWFATIGPAAIWATKEAIGFLAAGFWSLKNGVVVLWETINALVVTVAEPIMSLGRALWKLAHGDMNGATSEMMGMSGRVSDAWVKANEEILKSSEETAARIEQLFGPGHDVEKKKDNGKTAETKSGKTAADPSQMGEFKDALRLKLEAEGNFFKDSTAAELAYWVEKKSLASLSPKDRAAVNTEVFNLTKKLIADESSAQQGQIDQQRALGKERVALRTEEINALKAAGTISDAEALARLSKLHQEEFALDRAALEQKLTLYGIDAKERQKISDQLAIIDKKNLVTMAKDNAAAAGEVRKSWETAFKPISSSFDTAVKGVISGTTTIRKAVANMAKSILTEYVNLGVKTATQWAATEAAKTGATATGTAARGALESAAAIQSVALGAWAAIKNIMNYAVEAMAGAYKAIAAIPFVGPFMAPAAAAGAFAAVAAGVGSVASARGGYDIPAGVNPLTQLHEREMVLPAKQADAVRDMAEGGGGGGGNVELHVHATDAQSVARLFANNGEHIVATLRKQQRNLAYAR